MFVINLYALSTPKDIIVKMVTAPTQLTMECIISYIILYNLFCLIKCLFELIYFAFYIMQFYCLFSILYCIRVNTILMHLLSCKNLFIYFLIFGQSTLVFYLNQIILFLHHLCIHLILIFDPLSFAIPLLFRPWLIVWQIIWRLSRTNFDHRDFI